MSGPSLGRVLGAVALLGLAGCVVGPDFQRPAAPAAAGFTAEPLDATVAAAVHGGEAQRFLAGRDVPEGWWKLFGSPRLDALVEAALKANPDLAAAEAALRQAREAVAVGEGGFLPTVSGTVSAERTRQSAAGFGLPNGSFLYDLYNASVSVSYTPDLFGGTRRQVESLSAQEDYQRFQLEAAYLSLTANVVTASVQEASLRAQIAATQDMLRIERDSLAVVERQFALGGVAKADVLAQRATLAQTEASLPPLSRELAQLHDQLAAYAGRFPNEPGETFDLADLALPADLPVSLPSQLVEQRPDLRAAEAQLHAASAGIGVAVANMLPQLTLSGSYGNEAVNLGSLMSPANVVWSLGAGVTQPLLQEVTLLHKKREAEAAFDQAAAQYRSTVIKAFQNVADVLRALQSDADALAAQLAAERTADDSLTLARAQFQAGAVPYLTLLDAERTDQQARLALVQAQAARFADTAALFQALGGGWGHREQAAAAPKS